MSDSGNEIVTDVQPGGLSVQVPGTPYELPASFIGGQEFEFSFDLANLLAEMRDTDLSEEHGRRVSTSIAPPDPWLVTVAWVMTQAIANGLTWEAAKVVVQQVVKRLVDLAIAPKGPGEWSTEAGLQVRWSAYLEIPKLAKLFHDLEIDAKFKRKDKRK